MRCEAKSRNGMRRTDGTSNEYMDFNEADRYFRSPQYSKLLPMAQFMLG